MSSLLPHTKHIQCIYIITLSYLMQFCNSKTTYIPPAPHEGEFPTTTLSNGDIIPLVGLGGCSHVRKAHILSALDIGYRYFDTAQAYNWGYKEEDVGDVIHDSYVDRTDIRSYTDIVI
uniref:NADP-dependent oxidoreductase domain-containing protein n=1 Tax=Ditylum brightwellii TaxID=49249 RepID=A0A7S4S061_9STRA